MQYTNDLGREVPVQWFERQRFELRTDQHKPYDVQLGRLGAEYHELVSTLGFNDELGTDPNGPHFVPETGFSIGFEATPANPEGALYWDFYRISDAALPTTQLHGVARPRTAPEPAHCLSNRPYVRRHHLLRTEPQHVAEPRRKLPRRLPMSRLARSLVFVAVVSLALPSAQAAPRAISIIDFAYQPASAIVPAGDQVIWTNDDSFTHTVTFDAPAMGSGPLSPGAKYTLTTGVPGHYAYHCAIHPSMRASIDVVATPPSYPPRAYLPALVHTRP
jgi:plastocyanin